MTRASFANSAGWKEKKEIFSHRAEPPISWRIPGRIKTANSAALRIRRGSPQNLPVAVIHARRKEQEGEADGRGNRLLLEKIIRVSEALPGQDEARAVDHDDPESQEGQYGKQNEEIHVPV